MSKFRVDEVDLLDVWDVIWRHRFVALAMAALPLAVAAVLVVTAPKYYISEATILPTPKTGEGAEMLAAGMAAQVGPVAAMLGGFTPEKIPDLIEILSSRTLAARVIERLHFEESLKPWTSEGEMVDKLRDMVSVAPSSRTKAIVIRVEALEPKLAADVANAYVDELKVVLDAMVRGQASRRRKLIEAQMTKTRKDLLKVEGELVRAKSSDESWLLKQEIEARRSIYQSLVQQVEATLIAETRGSEAFLPMDRAVAPDLPASSKKKLFIPLGLLVGVTMGVIAAFVSNRLSLARQ